MSTITDFELPSYERAVAYSHVLTEEPENERQEMPNKVTYEADTFQKISSLVDYQDENVITDQPRHKNETQKQSNSSPSKESVSGAQLEPELNV